MRSCDKNIFPPRTYSQMEQDRRDNCEHDELNDIIKEPYIRYDQWDDWCLEQIKKGNKQVRCSNCYRFFWVKGGK